MFKHNNKPKSTSSDLEALIKSTSAVDHNESEIVSLKRRVKLKQQEKYGRIRLAFLVLAVLSIILLSFFTNTRPYQNFTVIVPADDYASETGKNSLK